MARTFRRQRQSAPIAELNLTNLIDLGFTLLIIFMIATPLINQEQTIPVSLPFESRSPQTKEPDVTFQSVTVRADGTISLGNRTVSRAELAQEFASYAAQANPPVIRLRADARAVAQDYVVVLDELKKANLSKVSIDTQVLR